MIDCRWLGIGGAGRATELLLRGLKGLQPDGRYVLWGPESIERYRWSSATHEPSTRLPTARWGQAEIRAVPSHDVALYMHQIRPLRPGPSVTVIYDTIPLRHGGDPIARATKRLYLRAATRLSNRIATLSEYSASCITRDLGVSANRVTVLPYPVDTEMSDRIVNLRRRAAQENVVLYVGRFAPHKNLRRLIAAFTQTRMHREGGSLLLVGGTADEIAELSGVVNATMRVELRGVCSQAELEQLYATSRVLVMPSLEEGFGLPAWEAATAGVPVCLSDIPVFRELFPSVSRFDPTSLSAITAAIDDAVSGPPPPTPEGPTTTAYAAAFIEHVRDLSR